MDILPATEEIEESCRARIIRALDAILFEAANMERAINECQPFEVDAADRRNVKATARKIVEQADGLMEWATQPARPAPLN